MRVRFKWQEGKTFKIKVGWWPFRRTVFIGHITFIGASLRASSSGNADMGLIELFNQPSPQDEVTYLGWSRTATPQVSTILHHPQGDLMKFTQDAQPAVFTTGNSIFANRGWRITLQGSGDIGITEGGSSGAALLNENHRICGQNFGGQTTDCSSGTSGQRTKDYGRFGISWNGDGAANSRLSNWLAPGGAVNELAPTFQLRGDNEISCAGLLYGIFATDIRTSSGTQYTYSWTSSSNLTIVGSGNFIQVQANTYVSLILQRDN